MTDTRIVSLVPSLTETLFDLGLGRQVVGRTRFCVHPAAGVADVPSVGGTKKVRMDRLLTLRPTHVLVNVDENPKEVADDLADAGLEVVVTHPLGPDDNPPLYRLLGRLFGREEAAEELARRFNAARAGLEALRLPERKVLYLIWQGPWMTVSRETYVSRTLALAGFDTGCFLCGRERYPAIEVTPELAAGVDLVLLSSEPFPFEEKHAEAFRRDFPDAAPVRLIDGEMTGWYGSRAVAAMAYMAAFAREA